MADPARFELTTSAFGGQRSIQLSYGSATGRTIAESPVPRNADALDLSNGRPAFARQARYWPSFQAQGIMDGSTVAGFRAGRGKYMQKTTQAWCSGIELDAELEPL
jgi:hypothetical protein